MPSPVKNTRTEKRSKKKANESPKMPTKTAKPKAMTKRPAPVPALAASTHRYRQVADELIAGIVAAKFPVDTFLPTEKVLCEQFGISRYTAREALNLVEMAGLIERRQGSGSIVVSRTPPVRYNHNIQNIDDLLQYGNASRLRALHSREIELEAEPAHFLHSSPGNRAILLCGVRLQRHDNRPFSFSRIYITGQNATTRKALLDPEHAVITMLKLINLKHVHHIEQVFSAVEMDDEAAKELGCEKNAAAFRTDRVYFDARGQVILYAASWHPGKLFSYSTVLQRN